MLAGTRTWLAADVRFINFDGTRQFRGQRIRPSEVVDVCGAFTSPVVSAVRWYAQRRNDQGRLLPFEPSQLLVTAPLDNTRCSCYLRFLLIFNSCA
jgi:hypothetical protein